MTRNQKIIIALFLVANVFVFGCIALVALSRMSPEGASVAAVRAVQATEVVATSIPMRPTATDVPTNTPSPTNTPPPTQTPLPSATPTITETPTRTPIPPTPSPTHIYQGMDVASQKFQKDQMTSMQMRNFLDSMVGKQARWKGEIADVGETGVVALILKNAPCESDIRLDYCDADLYGVPANSAAVLKKNQMIEFNARIRDYNVDFVILIGNRLNLELQFISFVLTPA